MRGIIFLFSLSRVVVAFDSYSNVTVDYFLISISALSYSKLFSEEDDEGCFNASINMSNGRCVAIRHRHRR